MLPGPESSPEADLRLGISWCESDLQRPQEHKSITVVDSIVYTEFTESWQKGNISLWQSRTAAKDMPAFTEMFQPPTPQLLLKNGVKTGVIH